MVFCRGPYGDGQELFDEGSMKWRAAKAKAPATGRIGGRANARRVINSRQRCPWPSSARDEALHFRGLGAVLSAENPEVIVVAYRLHRSWKLLRRDEKGGNREKRMDMKILEA